MPQLVPAGWILQGGYLFGPGAILTDAVLTNADLTGANLTGAILTDVTWSNTTCPDGTLTNTGC